MSDTSVKTCDLCGRLVVKGQSQCACGSRVSFGSGDSDTKQQFDYGKLLPIIPAVGFLAYVYIAINSEIIRFSGMPILKVMLVIFIASAAVALLVSDRAHKEKWALADTRFSGFNPPNWFAAVLVAWPVSFPLFMKVHYERTNPARLKMAQVAHIVFLLALGWVFFYGSSPEKPAPTVKPAQTNPAPAAVQPAPAQATPSSSEPAVSVATAAPALTPAPTLQPTATPPAVPTPQMPPQRLATATPYVPPQAPPVRSQAPRNQNRNSPSSSNSAPEYGVDILGKR